MGHEIIVKTRHSVDVKRSSMSSAYGVLSQSLAEINRDLLKVDTKLVNKLELQWNNELAVDRVDELISIYGYPMMYSRSPGGSAIWRYVPPLNVKLTPPNVKPLSPLNFQYDQIEVRDAAYYRDKPLPHFDFMTVTVPMRLKMNTLKNLYDITSSASYQQVGGLLSSGCNFIEEAIGTFAIIKQYNDGYITANDAREKHSISISGLVKERRDNFVSKPMRDAMEEYIFS